MDAQSVVLEMDFANGLLDMNILGLQDAAL
jgi:hypothetical protein